MDISVSPPLETGFLYESLVWLRDFDADNPPNSCKWADNPRGGVFPLKSRSRREPRAPRRATDKPKTGNKSCRL